MCGILFTLRHKRRPLAHDRAASRLEVAKRGPDALQSICVDLAIPGSGLELELEFTSSVLALRGDSIVSQPLRGNGQIFCWNGQVFRGLEVAKHENDTSKIWEQVCGGQAITDVLGRVEGP
jgi:asparagine synthetase B (glutamine-hydrolysing)